MYKVVLQKNKGLNVLKRTVAAVLVVSFIAPSLFILHPQEARAQFVPVGEVPLFGVHTENMLVNTEDAVQDTITAEQTVQNVTGKEYGFDGILWLVAKTLISQITADLVSWINSGFNGAPAFVQNFQGFMLNVADQALGAYLAGTSLAFLCDAFSFNISLSIQKAFFPNQSACKFTGILANVNNFINGAFVNGGFAGFFHMTVVPSNNMFGAYLMEEEDLVANIAIGKNKFQKQMDWGKGFLSFETCADPNAPLADQGCETQTPGTVIEDQLEGVLGSGVRQLEIADEFDEVIAALMGQLINQVLSQGLAALGGAGGGGGAATSFIGQLRTDIIAQERTIPTAASLGFPPPAPRPPFIPPPPSTFTGGAFASGGAPTGGTVGAGGSLAAFTYTISSAGVVQVVRGGLASVPITKTLQTGSAFAASLNILQAPSIATSVAMGNDPCTPSPTCVSNILFTVSPTAPVGFYTARVTGSPSPANTSIDVIIEVVNPPPPPVPGVVPPPPPAPAPTPSGIPVPSGAFAYTISVPGTINVAPGGLAVISVTKTLQSGTTQAAFLDVIQAPSIITGASFGNNFCAPTCVSDIVLGIDATAPRGLYTVRIGGSPAPANLSIDVFLNVQ